MIKLVAFDWNGTLLADTDITLRASNLTFKKFGLKPINTAKFRETFTIPIADFWKANGQKKKINFLEQSRFFHPVYENEAAKARTRKGCRKLLVWLGNNHMTRMIYSNHIAPDVVKQLLRLNIHEYFDEVLARSADDHSHVHSRGKDQKLFDYVKKHKLKPNEVLTIGDTEEEIQIGKKAGYFTVAITGGYNTTARLKKTSPDFLIYNLNELVPIIKKINNGAKS